MAENQETTEQAVAEGPAKSKPAAKKTTEKSPATKKPAAKAAEGDDTQPVKQAKAPAAKKAAPKAVAEKAQEQAPVEPIMAKELPTEDDAKAEPPIDRREVFETPVAAAAASPTVVQEPIVDRSIPAHDSVVSHSAQSSKPAQRQRGGSRGFAVAASEFMSRFKFPLFVVANALLAASALFMLISAFDISYIAEVNGQMKAKTQGYSLFGYLANAKKIKAYMAGVAGGWANGGYIILCVLMIAAVAVPLVLAIKNIVMYVSKKDNEVHLIDAIITFLFILAYLGLVNMYGGNITWSHVIMLIIASVLLAYTLFVLLIINCEGKFPIASIVNIVMPIVCMLLLTSLGIYSRTYKIGRVSYTYVEYAASAAWLSGAGTFGFIMMLVTIAALVLTVLVQLKKLPAILAIIVPVALFVSTLMSLICYGAKVPKSYGLVPAFVVGAVFSMLLAAADILLTLVPALKKYNVTIINRRPSMVVNGNVVVNVNESAQQPAESEVDVVFCAVCGEKNVAGATFCCGCGKRLQ